MKLFADLYLDEDVSVLVATLLRARGFDVLTAVEAGMLGRDDSEQLARASSHRRCIVSHNRVHFEALHGGCMAAGESHWGIIVAGRRNPYELVRRLVAVCNTWTADELANQLLFC
jgi:hypothetical protein